MAVRMTLELPGTTTDQYDQVNEKMDVENNPPDGLIIHTCAKAGDGLRLVDVWDSQGAYEKCAEERLGAAVAEVIGTPPEGEEGPDPEFVELHNVFTPSGAPRPGPG